MIITAVVMILMSTIAACQQSTPKPNKLQFVGCKKGCKQEDEDASIEKCNHDMNLNELCQRCEKMTESKSDDVFAMCCSNVENATSYCRDYVYYGVTQ